MKNANAARGSSSNVDQMQSVHASAQTLVVRSLHRFGAGFVLARYNRRGWETFRAVRGKACTKLPSKRDFPQAIICAITAASGRELDVAGLLLDFKQLKQVMRPVIDRLDHQMINDLAPFTELNPSAENLAHYFFDETNVQLRDMTEGRVTVKDCTIYETDTTTATYYE